jgi:hypothetical protein
LAWFGGLVWSAKLDKLALGDMTKQKFWVRGLILEIVLAWFGGLVWSA